MAEILTGSSAPGILWTSEAYTNPYWPVAYHTLFYTDRTSSRTNPPSPPGNSIAPTTRAESAGPLNPYTRGEVLAYWRRLDSMVDSALERLDLTAPASGFSWYQMPKLEHQLVNLRHLQHHTGQLADRLRQEAGRGVRWVGGTSKP